jgi:hypothetical protein
MSLVNLVLVEVDLGWQRFLTVTVQVVILFTYLNSLSSPLEQLIWPCTGSQVFSKPSLSLLVFSS